MDVKCVFEEMEKKVNSITMCKKKCCYSCREFKESWTAEEKAVAARMMKPCDCELHCILSSPPPSSPLLTFLLLPSFIL